MIKLNLGQLNLMYVGSELRSGFFFCFLKKKNKKKTECNICIKSDTPKSRNLEIDIMNNT